MRKLHVTLYSIVIFERKRRERRKLADLNSFEYRVWWKKKKKSTKLWPFGIRQSTRSRGLRSEPVESSLDAPGDPDLVVVPCVFLGPLEKVQRCFSVILLQSDLGHSAEAPRKDVQLVLGNRLCGCIQHGLTVVIECITNWWIPNIDCGDIPVPCKPFQPQPAGSVRGEHHL